jgi:hypothetical protein
MINWLRYLLSVFIFATIQTDSFGAPATVTSEETDGILSLTWTGDESIRVSVDKSKGPFNAPIQIRVDEKHFEFNGFYVNVNKLTDGFKTDSSSCTLDNSHIRAQYTLSHDGLKSPVKLEFDLWMETKDRGLRARIAFDGAGAHLDRLGFGDYSGIGIAAKRMFFGRMYVLDQPQAFEHEHNYNTCRFWCRRMENGVTELQSTGGPARGFRYDPAKRFDMFTYCESPVDYIVYFSKKNPQDIIAEYRDTITIPAPPTLGQLPGRVGVMTAYPIGERYEDYLEEFTARGARDFVWLSYWPTPGDRQKVEPYGALYAIYDTYLDAFKEGPRKMEGWTPEIAQYRDNEKMVRGYWSSSWVLPELYVKLAQTRVMGVIGHEFRNSKGELDWTPTSASRFSNLATSKAEIGPTGLYLDVHASKTPHHFFDHTKTHHGAWEHMAGEKALFEFARSYLGDVPIWSEGGGEDYAGLMDAGWFMDWRPPQEEGINCTRWQYYPFIDQIHRGRLLNMGIYYPLEVYDVAMMNAAILFGRPQGISLYYGVRQNKIPEQLMVYYMSKGFSSMLGLSRMERVDFQDDDIDRAIVSYSNGAKVWSNRSQRNWQVEDYVLPPMGWLVKGPDNFFECHALKDGGPVDVVRCKEYDFYATTRRSDFGPITIQDGAIAIMHTTDGPLRINEIRKPAGMITLKLGEIPGTKKSMRVAHAYVCLTRNRRFELEFPDIQQSPNNSDAPRAPEIVDIRPPEMMESVGYEIQFE